MVLAKCQWLCNLGECITPYFKSMWTEGVRFLFFNVSYRSQWVLSVRVFTPAIEEKRQKASVPDLDFVYDTESPELRMIPGQTLKNFS